MMRSRNFLKVIVFVAMCFVGDRLGGFLIERVFMQTRFRYAELYAGNLPADMVFIGNSRGVHMFHRPPIEEVTGQRIANLSFNGLPATMLPVVIGDYLEHHQPPRKLFVEVSCLGRQNEAGSLERFRILSRESSSFGQVHRRDAPVDYAACQLSHLYRGNSELLWRSVLFLRKTDQDWIMTSVLREDWNETLAPAKVRRFKPSSTDMEALLELKAITQRHDIELSLIFAPYFPGYLELTDGSDAWLSWIETETGQKVLDYSTTITDATHFADPIHLNPTGAAKLADLMFDRGEFPPSP